MESDTFGTAALGQWAPISLEQKLRPYAMSSQERERSGREAEANIERESWNKARNVMRQDQHKWKVQQAN